MASPTRRSMAPSLLVPFVLAALTIAASRGAAQVPTGTVTGTVVDSAGAPIVNATVQRTGAPRTLTTDEKGAFRITDVPAGTATISARRIGFRPSSVEILVRAGETTRTSLMLPRVVVALQPVTVYGRHQRQTGPMAGFFERRERGFGRFFSRSDIERIRPTRPTDLFRMVPGVRFTTDRWGRHLMYFRGANCLPDVFVDGMHAGAGYYDPDNYDIGSLEAVEIYSGPSTVPIEFQRAMTGSCGVIALWSRHGERRTRATADTTHLSEIVRLLESQRIFTADQVDERAVPLDSSEVHPTYPDSLYGAGVEGGVIVEFVVDTTGRVEEKTVGVVSASHPRFADAVLRAVPRSRFRPARRAGQPVRQLVQQPFRFRIEESADTAGTDGAPAGAPPASESASAPAPHAVVRVNQVGYLPDGPKVAVVCALDSAGVAAFSGKFIVADAVGVTVLGPRAAQPAAPFGPCIATWRLDFGSLREEGEHLLIPGGVTPVGVRIDAGAYRGTADSLLVYMRQQRSGWSPLFRDSVHTKDGIVVDDSARAGTFVAVSGGWADAADYLQYVTTSANATYLLLSAWRDAPASFGDAHDARGLPGANGIPDVADEARHGLEWLVRMFPGGGVMYNQLGDDRDHSYWDLPTTDSSDYGWGKGGARPVYPCTGRPQGLLAHVNRSDGLASTAGKYAAAFALGARLFAASDPAFAGTLRAKAAEAYAIGRANPGVCQTAPAGQPYFYEEANWVDDMELGAALLHSLTGERRYLEEALGFAAREPVTPWMGADTARHYEWYPWHNAGHFEASRGATAAGRATLADYYRRGLEAVAARADNGFRVGVPFIWCSNNLMVSLATQARLYREMTGDERFLELEAAALDWLFGTNPWGVSMVIGIPEHGRWARDPHSVIAKDLGVRHTGALLDGPVYRSIFESLRYVALREPDEYAAFNTGRIVYHDDIGDYSTNEPIMDGTANLAPLLARLGDPAIGWARTAAAAGR